MKAVPARSLGHCHFLVEIEIGGSAAGDQARTTIKREILDCPLDEHDAAKALPGALLLHGSCRTDRPSKTVLRYRFGGQCRLMVRRGCRQIRRKRRVNSAEDSTPAEC